MVCGGVQWCVVQLWGQADSAVVPGSLLRHNMCVQCAAAQSLSYRAVELYHHTSIHHGVVLNLLVLELFFLF